MSDEQAYREELAKAGVQLPELEAKEEAEAEPEEHQEALLQTKPEETHKRSIYEEYKEKKQELRSEREMREQAERERDELRNRVQALETAHTPAEKQAAKDELEAFAQEINADPQALKRMRDLFLKEVKPTQEIDDLRAFKNKFESVFEKQAFQAEYEKAKPALSEMFPGASSDEMDSIKSKLDELAHSKDFHDKELDYIAFKNRKTLNALVSPKKRGMETRTRYTAAGTNDEFDPNADLASMTQKQRIEWESKYRDMAKSPDVVRDAEGRRIIM